MLVRDSELVDSQLISGGMLALAHGTNDAQKTMGVITLALIANGNLAQDAGDTRLGHHLRRDRDRPWHLHRWLADHPHDPHPDHQDGHRAGILWLLLLGGSLAAIWRIWLEANTY
jgi:phosphate/sulfate permease